MIQESSDMMRTSTSSGNYNNTTAVDDYDEDEDGDEEPIMEISPISSSFQPIGVANVNANNNNAHAHSPPPESIHSEQLTTLSPPPLSLKSTTSARARR